METHQLQQSTEMTFACKKCKKCFRKDTSDWDENDEYCPHCDNHFVLDAREPQAVLQVEGEDVRVDSRMLIDDRVRQDDQIRSVYDIGKDVADKLR